MIKNITIFSLIIIFLVSCSSKPKPKDMQVGLTLTTRAIQYELQGKKSMAVFTYNRAIAKFRDMGRFCDMSRVAILLYSVTPIKNPKHLDDARAFAILGECRNEQNIINFLDSKKYKLDELEQPYKALAQLKTDNSTSQLKSIANSNNTVDSTRTFAYRQLAEFYLLSNPKESLKVLDKSFEINNRYGWTANLLADDIIRLKAYEKLGLNTDIIQQRINVYEESINEKY